MTDGGTAAQRPAQQTDHTVLWNQAAATVYKRHFRLRIEPWQAGLLGAGFAGVVAELVMTLAGVDRASNGDGLIVIMGFGFGIAFTWLYSARRSYLEEIRQEYGRLREGPNQ